MQGLMKWMVAAAAALGLAFAGGVLAQKAETPKDTKKTETKADTKKAAEPKKADAPMAAPMDINTASEKELASLKGIGDVRAKAIVKGRPYARKDELVQKKIIPESVYNDIKEQIIAKQDSAPAPKKAEAKPADTKKADTKKTEEKKK